MGRKRTKHHDLPKYMHFYRGAYYYKRSSVRVRLSRDRVKAFQKYAEITSSSNPNKTFADIAVRYQLEMLANKKPKTKDYENIMINEIIKVFGCMFPKDLRSSDIYKYMDIRSKSSVSMANRVVNVLSNLCNAAIRWGIIDTNPCKSVKKLPEIPRTRLVTLNELNKFKNISPEPLQSSISIAFLTAARRGEILNIKISDIKDDGLYMYDNKNERQYMIEWSETLKNEVNKIKQINNCKKMRSVYLINNLNGKPMTANGFSSMWQRTMKKALLNDVIKEKFTFHDIRAMAITQASNNLGLEAARQLAGHASDKITKRVYVRGISRRKPIK